MASPADVLIPTPDAAAKARESQERAARMRAEGLARQAAMRDRQESQ